MTKIIYIWLFCSLCSEALADGPPINKNGEITRPFVSVTLDSVQIEHLQSNRHIELTRAQRARLHFLKLPKIIDVLDPFHHDCTCGQVYGIWYQTDKLAFVYSDTTVVDDIYKGDPELAEMYDNYKSEQPRTWVLVGSSGQLYYQGVKITLKKLEEIARQRKGEKQEYLMIFQPPLKNNPNRRNVENTIATIRQTNLGIDIAWH
jgi:hypothetical protein